MWGKALLPELCGHRGADRASDVCHRAMAASFAKLSAQDSPPADESSASATCRRPSWSSGPASVLGMSISSVPGGIGSRPVRASVDLTYAKPDHDCWVCGHSPN